MRRMFCWQELLRGVALLSGVPSSFFMENSQPPLPMQSTVPTPFWNPSGALSAPLASQTLSWLTHDTCESHVPSG